MKRFIAVLVAAIMVLSMGTVAFAADPVAKIGNVVYGTLAEAIAAVGDGDVVIELLADTTLDYGAREAYGTEGTTSLTINGNNHTLTLNQTNSDWSSLGLKNDDATLVLKNMTIEKTGYGDTSGAWNKHAINVSSELAMENVTVNNSINVQKDANLKNVTINEANDYYAIWIPANGQNVEIDGLTVNSAGRGIKIDEQYVDDPEEVKLSVKNATFTTAKKAAIIVKSEEGAVIEIGENVDISKVNADSTNAVWVDEDAADTADKVVVIGGGLTQEAYNGAAVSTSLNGETLTVGVPYEFTVTTKNDNKNAVINVIGTSTFSDSDAIEKIEYYEPNGEEPGWKPLTGDQFGPATGFPLMDATSTFRVTFKTAGDYSLEFVIENADDGEIVCKCHAEFEVVSPTVIPEKKPDRDTVTIKIDATGKAEAEEDESNPNTGAPVIMPFAVVAAVLSGAAIIKRK